MNSRRCTCSLPRITPYHITVGTAALCITAKLAAHPPMRWVQPAHWTARPLFHRKRKSIRDLVMSQECQERAMHRDSQIMPGHRS
jgi:hypothetical protein